MGRGGATPRVSTEVSAKEILYGSLLPAKGYRAEGRTASSTEQLLAELGSDSLDLEHYFENETYQLMGRAQSPSFSGTGSWGVKARSLPVDWPLGEHHGGASSHALKTIRAVIDHGQKNRTLFDCDISDEESVPALKDVWIRILDEDGQLLERELLGTVNGAQMQAVEQLMALNDEHGEWSAFTMHKTTFANEWSMHRLVLMRSELLLGWVVII